MRALLRVLPCLLLAVPAWAQPRPLTPAAETDAPHTASEPETPALLVNSREPSTSRILTVTPKIGLRVYALTGELLQQIDVRDLVGVSTLSGLTLAREREDLAACIDHDGGVRFYRLGPEASVEPKTETVTIGVRNARAIALARTAKGDPLLIIAGARTIEAWSLFFGDALTATRLRTAELADDLLALCTTERGSRLLAATSKGVISCEATLNDFDNAAPLPGLGSLTIRGMSTFDTGPLEGTLLLSTPAGLRLYDLERRTLHSGVISIQGTGSIDPVEAPGMIATGAGAFGPAYPFGVILASDADNAPSNPNLKIIDATPIAERRKGAR